MIKSEIQYHEISYHQLEESPLLSKARDFLFHCYLQFRNNSDVRRYDDNLIMMWSSEFDRIVDKTK